jgi:hypothetical protein
VAIHPESLVRPDKSEYNGRSTNSIPRKILACPYFMPLAKVENGSWPHPARLPLGCGWTGNCTAPGHEGESPSQDVLETFCNLGYASNCGWAPPQRAWDLAPARVLRLLYVCELDHRPVAHGELAIDLAMAAWLRRHDDPRIQKMAECFLESYLKKKA